MAWFLPWIGLEVATATELLWYLKVSPPPRRSDETRPHDEVIPPPKVSVKNAERNSNLFAVIIGIDTYASSFIEDLRGAVADANEIERFLVEDLSVPQANILNLRNDMATRKAIESALQDLGQDRRILKDDPIFIYYAGHGAIANVPHGWPAKGKVEMLVPHDFIPHATHSRTHGQGILDVTLSGLLTEVAREKGDNITVVLDCGYTGPGNRNDRNDITSCVRAVDLDQKKYAIANDILDDMAEEHIPSLFSDFQNFGHLSHVLLTACKRGQKAFERHDRGAFTRELLSLWRKYGVDQLTYTDVVKRLPHLIMQNPRCKGVNQSRTIFNNRVSSPSRQLYQIEMSRKGGYKYVLQAGYAHNISNGAQFIVFQDEKLRYPLGRVTPGEMEVFESMMNLAPGQPRFFTFDQCAYALQTRAGEKAACRIFIEPHPKFLAVFVRIKDNMQRSHSRKRFIELVDGEASDPDLIVRINPDNDKSAYFEIMDPLCRNYDVTRMPVHADATTRSIYPILRGAVNFFWYMNQSHDLNLAPKISLSWYKLVDSGELNDDFEPLMIPDPDGEDLNRNGVITLHIGPELDSLNSGVDSQKDPTTNAEASLISHQDSEPYGFRITSKSNVPLFVSCFFFDTTSLEVAAYYIPAPSKEASIPPNGGLTVGFGDSRQRPFRSSLWEEGKMEVGYLKVFVTKEYVDFSDIQQDPFQQVKTTEKGVKAGAVWDGIKVAILQKPREYT